MPEITTKADNAIDGLPAHYSLLGVDARGDSHYWSTYETTVRVFDDDGEELHARSLECSLEAWVDYIADKRGWVELHYSRKSVAEGLADAVAAMEGGA